MGKNITNIYSTKTFVNQSFLVWSNSITTSFAKPADTLIFTNKYIYTLYILRKKRSSRLETQSEFPAARRNRKSILPATKSWKKARYINEDKCRQVSRTRRFIWSNYYSPNLLGGKRLYRWRTGPLRNQVNRTSITRFALKLLIKTVYAARSRNELRESLETKRRTTSILPLVSISQRPEDEKRWKSMEYIDETNAVRERNNRHKNMNDKRGNDRDTALCRIVLFLKYFA